MSNSKLLTIPIVSCFDYSNKITQHDINNAISVVDKLLALNKFDHKKPTYQTLDNLFLLDEFSIFKNSFIDSCFSLIKTNFKYQTHSFCYVDYYNNWILKNRNDQWHNHHKADLVGVFYLKNTEYPNNLFSGTEFASDIIDSNDRPTSIGYIKPVPLSWHIFSGKRFHRSGIIETNEKRYVLNAQMNLLF